MPAKNPEDFCQSCGQYIGPYLHGLSKSLVGALRKMYVANSTDFGSRPTGVNALTNTEYGNLDKLQYWLVAERYWHPERQSFVRGLWRITEMGEQFLHGKVALYERAITVLGEFQGYEGRKIYVHEVEPACWTWEDYVRERGTG